MRGVNVDVGLQRLAGYAREHGHANPPVRTIWLDWAIGIWVRDLRTRKRRGNLTPEQITEAESLGIDWTPPRGRPRATAPRVTRGQRREARMHASLDRLIPYWHEHGDINVRQLTGIEDWPQAGRFIAAIRVTRRDGNLPTSVEERADSMGIAWNPRLGRRRD
ncbi:MAG: helicase associated domain-containing protein [Leucobacter sp.]